MYMEYTKFMQITAKKNKIIYQPSIFDGWFFNVQFQIKRGVIPVNYEEMNLKDLIRQYGDLKEEVGEKRVKIQKLQDEIDKMNKRGYMESDVISFGKKGKKSLGTAKITGFPLPYYEQRKKLLERRVRNLADRQQKLLELITVIEEKIEEVGDSGLRRILALRYIEELRVSEVARQTGYSKGRISQIINDFLKD